MPDVLLKAAALAGADEAPFDLPVRCEGCGHPMSEGTWKGCGLEAERAEDAVIAEAMLRQGREPATALVHFSPCDEGCRHGGPGRYIDSLYGEWHQLDDGPARADAVERAFKLGQSVEASWRPVEVRTGVPAPLGHPHPMIFTRPWDLRPENLSVLCLRCWADR